jgi:alpha-tubulin suppressor-like RCC1 family protein
LTTWSKISGGATGGSAAIKTDGTLWSWGGNQSGEIGDFDVTVDRRSSPVQVTTINGSVNALASRNWSSVVVGNGFKLGIIKQDLS